jgi:hypothetical protein
MPPLFKHHSIPSNRDDRLTLDERSIDIVLARCNRYAKQSPNLARDILFVLLIASQNDDHRRVEA